MSSPRLLNISVLAHGHFNQTISLLSCCKLSNEEILEGLNNGTIVTSIQEDGSLQRVGGEELGIVMDTDNHLEYTDFELEP